MVLPELTLLGYQDTRPHLRVVSLPDERVKPSPVPLNAADCALDVGFPRDGWMCFHACPEVWAIPIPLKGKASRIGWWWDCVPSTNPRTVWLAHPTSKSASQG